MFETVLDYILKMMLVTKAIMTLKVLLFKNNNKVSYYNFEFIKHINKCEYYENLLSKALKGRTLKIISNQISVLPTF